MDGFEKMVVYGVSFDVSNKQPIVLLKTEDGNRYLPIWIGHPEAAAILMKLQNAELPRPMTHDLLMNILGQLEARLERILVTELRENTFYAVINLDTGRGPMDVDSRPSDAIALAVRADAPIYASTELLDSSGIEFDQEGGDAEEIVREFHDFLDHISPEDF
jgi:bifunctional DNase/RNase